MKLKFVFGFLLFLTLFSCKKQFNSDNYTAYFGGEVENATNPYILFCKGNEVIDTIPIKENHTFFVKFDSLAPGLYNFKNEPEYQNVYFDKNDSIKVHIDSKDFDNSVVFCGRGDEKNNFLMDMFLKNEDYKEKMFHSFDSNTADFIKFNDKINADHLKFYKSKKEEIDWNDDFDVFAKAAVDFPYYSKKEIYPIVHQLKTGNDISKNLPKNYYDFRKEIDFNNENLKDFSPFVSYLNHYLSNIGSINNNNYTDVDLSFKTNINKLNIADTLIKDEKVRNVVLNNIAFNYLLEDQNIVNNNAFIDTYYKYSTDKSQKNEILKIGNAIQLLRPGLELPKIKLIDSKGKSITSDDLITKKTVFYFWSSKLVSHLVEVHKKMTEFQKRYPDYNFIAINLNDANEVWANTILKYKFDVAKEFKCTDFEDIKSKWAITKIHRTIIVNNDKKIKNAFTNVFDAGFEKELKN